MDVVLGKLTVAQSPEDLGTYQEQGRSPENFTPILKVQGVLSKDVAKDGKIDSD